MFLLDLPLDGCVCCSGAVVSGGCGNIMVASSSPVVIIVDIDEFDNDNDDDDCHENDDELLEPNDDDDPISCICDVDCIIFFVCDSQVLFCSGRSRCCSFLQVAKE